jgi:hypothetical protein
MQKGERDEREREKEKQRDKDGKCEKKIQNIEKDG